MDCRFGRSNQYNIQYHVNTSNHKWTTTEIGWHFSNCTNLNGFQWFTIQYVEWFRLIIFIPLLCLISCIIMILIVFNRFNPSILNNSTYSKQSLPIVIDFKSENREKSAMCKNLLQKLLSGETIDEVATSIDRRSQEEFEIALVIWEQASMIVVKSVILYSILISLPHI